MKLDVLIANRGNGVSSQNLIRNPSKLIDCLSGSRSHFFQSLASACDGVDRVKKDFWSAVDALVLRSLFNQDLLTSFSRTERVGRVTHPADCILNVIQIKLNILINKKIGIMITSTVRMKALSPFPKLSPATRSTCNMVARAFLILMDQSGSEDSASRPLTLFCF